MYVDSRPDPILVHAANPGPMTGAGNNTWLVEGAEPALIDAGVGAPEHLVALERALGGRPLVRVLVTHGHPDHATGVPAIRARWPDVEVCRWRAPDDDSRDSTVRGLADGEHIRAGDADLVAVHTPGHAPDHLCFWNMETRDLFGGDMLIAGTTVMIPAGHGGSLAAYLESLAHLAALAPRRVLPGHGPIIENPLDLIDEYVAHRRQREDQILECLASGATTVDAIVARVYPGLADAVRPAARLTVQAHLDKLRDEGRWP
jgi:glyoxylase-like metal-dependent hydrolase (beta-lactamase superfamily II)